MIQYILRRVLVFPLIMFLVTVILFALMLQPPVEQRVMIYVPSFNPHITGDQFQELLARQIERYGLDDPFPVQYVRWLRDLATGEWGFSPTWRQPVLEGLRQRAPATLELAIFALTPSVVLALGLGSLAARYHNRFPDYVVRAATFTSWAFPPFILGLILMNVFYAWLGWFPPERLSTWATFVVRSEGFYALTGMHTVDALLNGDLTLFVDAVRHLVLPGVTLAIVQWALFTRVMRASLTGIMNQDYITAARAKGLSNRQVIRRHARRNAILPVVSLAGTAMSAFISNVVVVEMIFYINGVGRWAAKAILQADVPVALGFALFGCMVTVLTSLIADILYGVLDPRVRLYQR